MYGEQKDQASPHCPTLPFFGVIMVVLVCVVGSEHQSGVILGQWTVKESKDQHPAQNASRLPTSLSNCLTDS